MTLKRSKKKVEIGEPTYQVLHITGNLKISDQTTRGYNTCFAVLTNFVKNGLKSGKNFKIKVVNHQKLKINRE